MYEDYDVQPEIVEQIIDLLSPIMDDHDYDNFTYGL